MKVKYILLAVLLSISGYFSGTFYQLEDSKLWTGIIPGFLFGIATGYIFHQISNQQKKNKILWWILISTSAFFALQFMIGLGVFGIILDGVLGALLLLVAAQYLFAQNLIGHPEDIRIISAGFLTSLVFVSGVDSLSSKATLSQVTIPGFIAWQLAVGLLLAHAIRKYRKIS